jgi:hypothetical protein
MLLDDKFLLTFATISVFIQIQWVFELSNIDILIRPQQNKFCCWNVVIYCDVMCWIYCDDPIDQSIFTLMCPGRSNALIINNEHKSK